MRKALFASLFCLSPCLWGAFALAGDPVAPVREIMDATTNNWAEGDHPNLDIFDEAHLTRLYSRDFVARYRAAAKFPAYDDGASPFDYDVIVNGQDGCPLTETAIAVKQTKGPVTEVDATFKNMTCIGPEPDYQKASTVRFMLIDEDGKAVIDDIMTEGGDDGAFTSVKALMTDIASQQQ